MLRGKKKFLVPVLAAILVVCMAGTALAYIGTHYFWSDWFDQLKVGGTNPVNEVKTVQQIINFDSLIPDSLTVDGSYGSLTKTAVQHFQTSVGISADGIVGPDTWNNFQARIYFNETISGDDYYKIKLHGVDDHGTTDLTSAEYLRHLYNGTWQLYNGSGYVTIK